MTPDKTKQAREALSMAETQVFWLCTELKDDKQNEIANAALENIRKASREALTEPAITAQMLEGMVRTEAVEAFLKKGSYLSHPDVRPFRGTENGDTIESWYKDYATALVIAAILDQQNAAIDKIKEMVE